MPSASDELRAAIEAAGGALRFDEFMRIALYGDHGFYTTGGQAGRRGDFITSPEVGPLFGAVLARWIDAEWHLLGEPDDFTIVECGAGPGTLARSVLAVSPQWRGHYFAVEVAERQRREHPDGVVSTSELPRGALDGVVIANELLDNLPFRLAIFDGGWREVAVAVGRGGGFVEIAIEPDPAWGWLPTSVPHATRLPIQDQAAAWVSSARDLLRQGSVMAFDYCTTTAELVGRPWREWLRTYRAQARGQHYLADPGTQDITAQVCVDQLPPPALVESQAQFMQRWGIDELVEEGRLAWASSAARPDVRALSMRSRIRECEALVDLNGLGAFGALIWPARTSAERRP
ncbi:MAG: SAM-dependent methyltransferase [Ilumatobacteraceae bacterium]